MESTSDTGSNAELPNRAGKSPSPQNPDILQTDIDHDHVDEVTESPQAEAIENQPSPRASSSKACKVCNDQQAKYKCSRCEIPYCSVSCATLHRAVPCEALVARSLTPVAVESTTPNGPTRPLPGTVASSTHGNIFSVLESSQKLQTLFIMYPRLRSQLREIYSATLPPTNDSGTLGLNHENSYHSSQRGRGGERAGITKGNSTRPPGPWNSDRGTQDGIDALAKAKLEYGKGGEGVREYANLVLNLVAADGVDVARLVQDEVAEENAKIIAQLLNGDKY